MSQILLALDTATERTTVGLARVGADRLELIGAAVVDAPRAAMSRLLPMTESLLAANDLTVAEVGGVIVGRGPGSFTGVRIGVATAKGLAHGLSCPLWGVSTLDAIAWMLAHEDTTVAVVGDAMRGEVYPALFRCGGGRAERLTPDRVAKPADVAAEWAALGHPLLLAGNGLHKYSTLFAEALADNAVFADEELWPPYAHGLFGAWVAQLASGERGSGEVADVLPVYTRLSDAEENERTRAGLPSAPTPGSGVSGGVSA
ncbi:MAG: tRNA (adenosine(37)-N6)-threonylcarbamoyltransferase complex dimerization subunit type 1 TsaB [Coriobacteriia bacterium]